MKFNVNFIKINNKTTAQIKPKLKIIVKIRFMSMEHL